MIIILLFIIVIFLAIIVYFIIIVIIILLLILNLIYKWNNFSHATPLHLYLKIFFCICTQNENFEISKISIGKISRRFKNGHSIINFSLRLLTLFDFSINFIINHFILFIKFWKGLRILSEWSRIQRDILE